MAHIGNIGGPSGKVPQKSVQSQDAKGAQASKTSDASKGAPQAKSKDRADISAESQSLLAKARAAFDQEPEIREDVVARVKARIESGYYNSADVVDSLAEGLAKAFRRE